MMKKKVALCKKNPLVVMVLSVCSVFVFLPMAAGLAQANGEQTAVVATAAADYSSGAHSIISVDPVGGPRDAQNNLLPTISDISVAAFGSKFYRIERYNADNVTKFDIAAPDTVIWQYSTLDDPGDPSSNPHGLVFLSSEKAYLFRYGTTKAWIVNPSATTEAGFKIGELDLSSYADSDGIPEMENGVIVDDKLFIIIQRLDRNSGWVPGDGYVAVFDTTTDTEIDTGSPDPVLGIPLEVKNPLSIQYLEANDTIYVQGAGDYYTPEYTGGIESINPDTYATSLILDDGLPYGNISGMAIISPTKGYFVGYAGWGDNTLYTFDPGTGTVGGAVTGLENKNIAGMESGIYPDKNNMLWVCNQTDATVDILDIANDTIDESVYTDLNPQKVVFATGLGGGGGDDGGGGGSSGCFISTSASGL